MGKKIQILKNEADILDFMKSLGIEKPEDGIDMVSTKRFRSEEDVPVTMKSYKKSGASIVKKNSRVIKGYASTPNIDYVKDSVTMECLTDAKNQLLQPGTSVVLLNHNPDMPVGKVFETNVDSKGLFIEAIISRAKDCADIWTKIKEKIIDSFSIRFIPKQIKIVRDTDGTLVSFNIEKMQILEVSVTPTPMNSKASITEVIGKNKVSSKNSKKGAVDMDNKEKKQLVSEIVEEVLGDKIEKALKPINDFMKAQTDATAKATADAEAKKKSDEEAKVKADAEAKKTADEAKAKADADAKAKAKADADAKAKADADAKAKADADTKKGRKGKEEGEEDDNSDEGKDKEVPKALKSIEDEATCLFVMKAMGDTDVYDKLSLKEKGECKSLYFQMLKSEKKI